MHFDDASRALVELATCRHNAFHTTEVADIPAHRLRRASLTGELTRLGPRIWSVTALGHPPGQRLRAATLGTAGSAAAQRSSGWLHGWFDHPPHPIDIWTPRSLRHGPPPGVRVQRGGRVCPDRDLTEVDGIRTLNPAATLCLLGRTEDDRTLERCLDAFLLDHPQSWLVSTLDRLWVDNGAGPAALRRVLNHPARSLGQVESPLERRLVEALVGADLPPLSLQHPVTVGAKQYRIDVAIPSIKLGIEGHGRRFHFGRQATEADNERDLALASVGWRLLYVTWSQLQHPKQLARQITAAAHAPR